MAPADGGLTAARRMPTAYFDEPASIDHVPDLVALNA